MTVSETIMGRKKFLKDLFEPKCQSKNEIVN